MQHVTKSAFDLHFYILTDLKKNISSTPMADVIASSPYVSCLITVATRCFFLSCVLLQ